MIITKELLEAYEPTIGIECHVQLKTKTKLFSGVSNNARGAAPNTLVSPICFGLPGVLPVLNKQAVELAIRAGVALNAQIATFSTFDRKHYFYPDLPKGYQITQFDQPIVGKGVVHVPLDGQIVDVGITRAHLEEDAGKSTHPAGKEYSLVDLNRAGTPLLEIVSEPDIHSPEAARAYAQELYYLMKYAEVSDVDLYEGNMRFDVNISVAKKGSGELGTRAEVKNLNSFRSVEKAAEYEFRRQIEVLEKGQKVVQETRGWDDAKMKTSSQRTKEEAHDYRYFPEPDIPPLRIELSRIEAVKAAMPPLPSEMREKLNRLGLDTSQVSTLLEQPKLMMIQLKSMDQDNDTARRIANWLTVDVQSVVSQGEYDWDSFVLDHERLQELSQLVAESKLSSTAAKEVLFVLMHTSETAQEIATKLDLLQMSDESAIEGIVQQILDKNPKAVEDIRSGEMKAIGFLVGQVMKESKGKANPQTVQKLIREKLV